MKIFTRYICKEFFKLFIICLVIFLSIYLVVDFFEKIDNFLGVNIGKDIIALYFLYKLPYIITQMIPVAVLISVIILFCQMKKNNEITALKSCGIHLVKIFSALFVLGVFMSLLMFITSEMIVPVMSEKSNEIWDVKVENRDYAFFHDSNHIWYKAKDAIYSISHFDRKKNIIYNPVFYFFDPAFHLVRRVDGLRGVWAGNSWKIEDGIIQERTGSGGYDSREFRHLYLEIPEKPETFGRSVIRPEDMSYGQMKRFAAKVKEEGYDNGRYLVDLNLKIALPFICFIFIIIGIPVSLFVPKGGTPLAVTAGVGLCFIYMVLSGFFRSLGISGTIPPVLSAWTPNIIFLFFSMFLITNYEGRNE